MLLRTQRERDEDLTRSRRGDAAPPAPAAHVLALQRRLGNRAVAAMLARDPVADTAPTTDMAQAIADRDIGAIKAIDDYSPASDAQRIEMIEILLDQFWVGPRDEAALERIWASFGERLPAMMATRARLWADCVDRGAELKRWTRYDNLALTCEISPGVINDRQVGRAVARVGQLNDADYLQLRQLIFFAASGAELAFICKALAAER